MNTLVSVMFGMYLGGLAMFACFRYKLYAVLLPLEPTPTVKVDDALFSKDIKDNRNVIFALVLIFVGFCVLGAITKNQNPNDASLTTVEIPQYDTTKYVTYPGNCVNATRITQEELNQLILEHPYPRSMTYTGVKREEDLRRMIGVHGANVGFDRMSIKTIGKHKYFVVFFYPTKNQINVIKT